MALGARLPLVGAQAVILGMAAFSSNAKTVEGQLRSMGQAAYYLDRTSSRAFNNVSASFGGLATAAGAAAAVLISAATAAAGAAVIMSQRYGKEMAFVGAIAELTSSQVRELNNVQLAISRTSTTNATDLAKVSGEMLKAGVAFKDVTEGGIAAANAMVVASNGELDAARAASIAQVATAAFSATQTTITQAANAATAAVQKSSITFTGFADALRQGGAVAARAGLTFEQFAAVVATVGQQITSGTEIGTGLRVMFQRLQNPTDEAVKIMQQYRLSLYDAQGAVRPFFDTLTNLEQAFGRNAIQSGKLTQAQRDHALAVLFDTRVVKTLSVLLDEGTDQYVKMLDAAGNTDVFEVAADIMRATGNQMRAARNNAEALAIAFGEGLDPVINHATGSLLRWLQTLDLEKAREFGRTISNNIYNAFSSLGVIIPQLLPFVGSLVRTLALLATVPVAMTVAGWIVALNGWLGRLAFAASSHATFVALTVANFARTAAGAVASFAVMTAAAAVWAATMVGNALIVSGAFAVQLVRAVVAASAVVVAAIAAQSAAVIAYSAGAVAVLATATAAHLLHSVQAVAAATAVALVYSGALAIALIEYSSTVARVVGVAIAAFTRQAAVAIATALTTARAFAVTLAQSLAAFARTAVAVSIAVGRAFILNMARAVVAAVTTMVLAFGPLLLGVAAIGTAVFLLAKAWANNWGDIQGIVGRAVQWIIEKLNAFLDALEQLPIIGEFIGGARAGIAGFFNNLPGFVVTASNAVQGFVSETIAGFKSIQNLKLPEFSEFADDLAEVNRQADAARDAVRALENARVPSIPTVETEPGVIPGADGGGGGGDDAAKAAEKAAEELANAIGRAEELVEDFNDDVRLQTERTANDIAKLYDKAGDDIAASMNKASKDIGEAIDDTNKKLQGMADERAIREDADRRRNALEDVLDEQTRMRDEGLEIVEQGHEWELEDAKRMFDEQQELARRANDKRLEDAAITRDIDRENEDRAFEKSQDQLERNLDKELDAEENALKERIDLRERELEQRQDQEERALEARLDALEEELDREQEAEEDALKKRQDQREDALQAQLDAEARLREEARDIAEISREDTEARAKAESEYTKELSIGVKQSIAQARLDEKLRKIQEDTQEARAQFDQRKLEAGEDLAFEAQQEARLQDLREQFDREDLELEARHENKTKELREANERALLDLRALHEAQMVDLRRQAEEAMTELRVEHEHRRIDLTERLEQDASRRRRDRAEEDRQFANDQEQAKRDFAERQEREALKESRRIQDEERIRRNELDRQETEFKARQEQARDALRKQLEEEDYQRQLVNVRREHDLRIAQINETLAEEQEKTRTKLDQDVKDLQTNLDERIDTIRSQYVDRLEDIMRAGGEAIMPMVDEITGHIAAGLDSITESANATIEALAAAFDASEKLASAQANLQAQRDRPGGGGGGGGVAAPLRPGGKPGETEWEVKNFLENQAKASAQVAADAAALAGIGIGGAAAAIANALGGFQYGGEVPGRFGEEVLVRAHGGERFEGIGSYGTTMTAVRMAEAMYQRGTQGTGVTNNYSYNVEANYGRVQPEGSVRQDLGALVALTRR